MKRKVIGLLRFIKILVIRSLAQNRIMEIENFIKVDNLVFQKITEVGNLCRAWRAWEKTGREPGTPPPIGGGLAP
jgi:hypothetical protein